jgi:putative ABC transport system permease protein
VSIETGRPAPHESPWHAVPNHARRAARSLARRPALSLLAILTLGLGIGANTAIFSIINVVLLKPLPFPEPDRLVLVSSTAPSQRLTEGFASYPDFHDWSEQARSFDRMAAFWTFPNGDVNLTGGTEPQRVSVARITPGFFEVLGIHPRYGRTFQREETVIGNHRRVILSHGLWRRHFGGDSTLVGRSVLVNGFPYTVVGIMPPELPSRSVRVLGTDVDLWRPLVPEDNQTGGRDARKLRVIGRLARGVTAGSAEAELSGITTRLASIYPETNREVGAQVAPLREQVVRDARRGLILLLGAVGVVLLGACVNVANLLLMKAAATRRQTAVQHALGASRSRLGAQVLTESLLLGIAGAALGVLLAYGGIAAFIAAGPQDIPLLPEARIDRSVLGFTLVVTFLTVLLVGVAPAWRSTRLDATAVLRQSGDDPRTGEERRLMRGFTVAQIALAMVLLSAGGLLVRSFQSLLRVDPGLAPERVLTFQLELPMGAGMPYSAQEKRDVFFATLLERIGGLPGVRGASFSSAPPLEEEPSAFSFTRPGSEDTRVLKANFRLVGPEYFSLLEIPVVQGRGFDPADGRSGRRVVVVSKSLAEAVWGGQSPIGQRIAPPFGGEAEVVGVAGDVRAAGLDSEPVRTVYAPALQGGFNFMTLLVRTEPDPRAILPGIRTLVAEQDPNLPLYRVYTIEELIATSVAPQRFQMLLVSTFSMLALLLAIIGTYGVASYAVSRRSGELGIRMALGATGHDIRRLVLREGAAIAGSGILLGAVAIVVASRALSRFAAGTSALDPVTLSAVALLLLVAVLGATLVPAWRATRVDPTRALRAE